MTNLTIKDLPHSEELDSSAMAATQGGKGIAPGVALKTELSSPAKLAPILDPIGPYGTNGFVLPDGVAD